MLFDSHCHTNVSTDSEMEPLDAINAARAKNLGLVFTDHMDIDMIASDGKPYVFDPKEFWTDYEPLRSETLSLGVELGITRETREQNAAVVREAPFDLIIGSLHFLNRIDIYSQETFAGREKDELYHEYFAAMSEEIYAHPFINTLAHIDFIARVAPYDDPEITYAHYSEDIDRVLKALVDTDTAIEVNTRRLGDRSALKAMTAIYARYRDLGGRYVTIGSDAHIPDAVGANFDIALDLVHNISLEAVTFREQQLVKCVY